MFVDHRKSEHPKDASAEVFSGEVFDETEVRPLTQQRAKSLAPTNKRYDLKLVP